MRLKTVRELQRAAEKAGANVVHIHTRTNGHYALVVEGSRGRKTVFAPGTTSDARAIHRVVSKLKHAQEEVS